MPTPKKKTSRMRRGHRRSHDALSEPGVAKCANCGSYARPHHVCPSCGYYKGQAVVSHSKDQQPSA